MIVGYTDEDGRVYCTACWLARAEAGSRPAKVLDSEDPDDPGGNFWVVDDCTGCGSQVKSQAATALN